MEYSTIWQESLMPGLVDYGVIIIYLFIILFGARSYQNKKINSIPAYKYFVSGLFFKILVGLGFCLIYTLYYGGGDTTGYFISSEAMINVLAKKGPEPFFNLLSGNQEKGSYVFDAFTGLVFYWHDPQAWSVVRFTCLFTIFGFMNYFTTTILLDVIAYIGIWKLYVVFTEMYPDYIKKLALGVLFVPSIAFWGSGIMKDTYTLSAACWLTYNFYKIFIKKEKLFINILLLIVNMYIILSIKPYIILYDRPEDVLPKYSSIIEEKGVYEARQNLGKKAQTTQQDLTREGAYGGNYYDVGKFDATPSGMIKKAPEAITAALFRPFLWEANNPVMLISGLENTVILFLTIFIFFKVGVIKTFGIIGSEPLLFFSLIFAILFSFSVGIASGNFGAMVRYRIPCMIFYIPALFILLERMKTLKAQKE